MKKNKGVFLRTVVIVLMVTIFLSSCGVLNTAGTQEAIDSMDAAKETAVVQVEKNEELVVEADSVELVTEPGKLSELDEPNELKGDLETPKKAPPAPASFSRVVEETWAKPTTKPTTQTTTKPVEKATEKATEKQTETTAKVEADPTTTQPATQPVEKKVDESAFESRDRTVYVTTAARIRSGPSTDYTILTVVQRRTELHQLGTNGTWSKVRLQNGTEGYINNSLFQTEKIPVETTQPPANNSQPAKLSPLTLRIAGDNYSVLSAPNYFNDNVQGMIDRKTKSWVAFGNMNSKTNGDGRSVYLAAHRWPYGIKIEGAQSVQYSDVNGKVSTYVRTGTQPMLWNNGAISDWQLNTIYGNTGNILVFQTCNGTGTHNYTLHTFTLRP